MDFLWSNTAVERPPFPSFQSHDQMRNSYLQIVSFLGAQYGLNLVLNIEQYDHAIGNSEAGVKVSQLFLSKDILGTPGGVIPV